MTAPERIWATEDAENFGEDRYHSVRPHKGLTEYIRADLCDPLSDPRVKALVEAAQTMIAAYRGETDGTIAGYYALETALSAFGETGE